MAMLDASLGCRRNARGAQRREGAGLGRSLALVIGAAIGVIAPSCASEVPSPPVVGGGGPTGGAGASGGGGCEPGSTRPCYGGPDGTEGVGTCLGGVETCKDDGSGYGDCAGEVQPTAERCETPEDDDCDGAVNEADGGCVCEVGATEACYSGPPETEGVGECAGGTAECILGTSWSACAGEVVPAVEDCTKPSDEDCDGIVCSAPVWGSLFGGTGNDRALSVAADASGNTYVTGKFSGIVDFGGGPLESAGGDDMFLVKLDAQGAHVWSRTFGDANDQYGNAVAIDPTTGDVIVAGYFAGTITFDTALSASGYDGYVARLAPDGAPLWSARLGGAGDDKVWALAVGPSGEIAVSGGFNGTHYCLQGLPPVCKTSAGGDDVFLRLYAPGGGLTLVRTLGSAGDQTVNAAAFDSAGNLLLAGQFQGTLDFEAPSGPLTASASRSKAFVAKLDPPFATAAWSAAFGDTDNDQRALGIAVDATDQPAIVGAFDGSIAFDAVLNSAGSTDAFVAKLDAAGAPLWSRRFGNLANQWAQGVAYDAAGDVLVTGGFEGVLDFGGGPVVSGGGYDLFLVKLGPLGDHLWSKGLGNVANQFGFAVTADPTSSQVAVAGYAAGAVDFGLGQQVLSAGAEDALVARFQP